MRPARWSATCLEFFWKVIKPVSSDWFEETLCGIMMAIRLSSFSGFDDVTDDVHQIH